MNFARICKHGLIFLIVGFLLAACATSDRSAAEAEDAWRMRITETWAPKLHQANAAFQKFALSEMGVRLDTETTVLLAASQDEAKRLRSENPQAVVMQLSRSMAPQTLYGISAGMGVSAQMQALQTQLTAGRDGFVPLWLRKGPAADIANRITADLGSPLSAQGALANAGNDVRAQKDKAVSPRSVFSGEIAPPSGGAVASTNLLMTAVLQDMVGANFWPRYADYLRLAADPKFNHTAAFSTSFGVTEASYLEAAQTRFNSIMNERRQHSQAIPADSDYAQIGDIERFPLQKDTSLGIYSRYRNAATPKALAFSPLGAVAFRSDNSDAMAEALNACRSMDSLRCQLYAVDDRVVYHPPSANTSSIEVRWASSDAGEWNLAVKNEWLPLTQAAVAQFNVLIQKRLGAGLSLNSRIYVTANEADYDRILRQELGLLKSLAEESTALTGGLSNGKGNMATIIRERHKKSPANLRRAAITVPLHELTHDLQSQLSQIQHSRGPKWMNEGSANYFAYAVAQDMALENATEITLAAMEKLSVGWYKKSNNRVDAEDVWTSSGANWRAFVAQKKGPYEMSSLMVLHLKHLVGDAFYAQWIAYYRAFVDSRKQPDDIFEQSFGISRDAFLASFNAYLETL